MAKRKPEKGSERRRYIIGARKIAAELRDVAGPVLAGKHAQYMDVMSSNDDPAVEIGTDVAYAAHLTEEEAERFRGASNVRYVAEDDFLAAERPDGWTDGPAPAADGPVAPAAADAVCPDNDDMDFMGATAADSGPFTGAGVRVAVLGGGTSQAMRDRFTWTRVAYRAWNIQPGDSPLPADGVMWEDACFQTSVAVPTGGELVEAMVQRSSTSNGVNSADLAAAMIWACDQGAEIIFAGFTFATSANQAPFTDAHNYLRARGRQMVWPAGFNGQTVLQVPMNQVVDFQNVSVIGAWDDVTDNLRTGANSGPNMSGVLGIGTSGNPVAVVNRNGLNWTASGYHLQACKAVRLMGKLNSGATYTAQQAGDGLKASARNTGDSANQQGKGYWRLDNAINYLAPSLVPSGSLHCAQTIRQPIANNTETKIRYQTARQYSADVAINAAHDTVTIHNPGLYLITASCRWIGFANTTGDKLIAIGNNVPWTATATKRWKTDSRRGTNAAMGQTVMHVQRFEVGDQLAIWANQSSGITWDLEPTIGAPFADPSTLTVTRISA